MSNDSELHDLGKSGDYPDLPDYLKRAQPAISNPTTDTAAAANATAKPIAQSYPFHPIADMFPLIKDAEFAALVEDIRVNSLNEPITIYENKILDGRNRERACHEAGVEPNYRYHSGDHASALALVISANLHRRHLTPEQKRDLIEKLLKANPEQSDRQIAKVANVNHETVGAVRTKVEGRGGIRHVEKRTDTKGRKQPVTRPTSNKADQIAQQIEPAAEANTEIPGVVIKPDDPYSSETLKTLPAADRVRIVANVFATLTDEEIRAALPAKVKDAIIERAVNLERAHVAEENRVLEQFAEAVTLAVATNEDVAEKYDHICRLVRKFNRTGDNYPTPTRARFDIN